MAVDDVDYLVDVTWTVSLLDELPGPRIGVITTSGGAGVHIADVCEEEGLELPELPAATRERIESYLPAYGSALNPVDITAQVVNSPAAFRDCLDLLLAEPSIDTVILQITNATGRRAKEYASFVAESVTDSGTPLFVSWTGGLKKAAALERYQEANVPVFENPAACVQTIAAVCRHRASKPRLRAAMDRPARPPEPSDDGPSVLTEIHGKKLLAEYGVAVPEEQLVLTAADAVAAADDIGYPVVAKLVSPDVQHRDQVGGVRTDLSSATEVQAAYEDLAAVAGTSTRPSRASPSSDRSRRGLN